MHDAPDVIFGIKWGIFSLLVAFGGGGQSYRIYLDWDGRQYPLLNVTISLPLLGQTLGEEILISICILLISFCLPPPNDCLCSCCNVRIMHQDDVRFRIYLRLFIGVRMSYLNYLCLLA